MVKCIFVEKNKTTEIFANTYAELDAKVPARFKKKKPTSTKDVKDGKKDS